MNFITQKEEKQKEEEGDYLIKIQRLENNLGHFELVLKRQYHATVRIEPIAKKDKNCSMKNGQHKYYESGKFQHEW